MGSSLEWAARTRRQEHRLPMRGAACVVEPDDAQRGALADALRNMGYTAHETASGKVGAFIADQLRLKVVLVNIAVPDARGLAVIRRFRQKNPGALIIALTPTGSVNLGGVLSSLAGADRTLALPASPEALGLAMTDAASPEAEAPIEGAAHPA